MVNQEDDIDIEIIIYVVVGLILVGGAAYYFLKIRPKQKIEADITLMSQTAITNNTKVVNSNISITSQLNQAKTAMNTINTTMTTLKSTTDQTVSKNLINTINNALAQIKSGFNTATSIKADANSMAIATMTAATTATAQAKLRNDSKLTILANNATAAANDVKIKSANIDSVFNQIKTIQNNANITSLLQTVMTNNMNVVNYNTSITSLLNQATTIMNSINTTMTTLKNTTDTTVPNKLIDTINNAITQVKPLFNTATTIKADADKMVIAATTAATTATAQAKLAGDSASSTLAINVTTAANDVKTKATNVGSIFNQIQTIQNNANTAAVQAPIYGKLITSSSTAKTNYTNTLNANSTVTSSINRINSALTSTNAVLAAIQNTTDPIVANAQVSVAKSAVSEAEKALKEAATAKSTTASMATATMNAANSAAADAKLISDQSATTIATASMKQATDAAAQAAAAEAAYNQAKTTLTNASNIAKQAALAAEKIAISIDISAMANLSAIVSMLMTPTGNLIVPGDINFTGMVKVNGTEILPIGSIIAYTNNTLPSEGWLWCDGTSIADAKYSELRTLLGASTTPNMTGRVIIGAGQGVGLTNRGLKEMGGAETVALTEAQMPSHNHGVDPVSHTHTISRTQCGEQCDGEDRWVLSTESTAYTSTSGYHNHEIYKTGSGSGHNNMQAYLGLNYIIRAL